jgi:KilA-N domain
MTKHNSIIKFFEGKKIRIDKTNNYPNLTDMARATGKKVTDFLRLDNTKEFIDELSLSAGIPVNEIYYATPGNTHGSWGHPKLAIKFAGWLSAKFEVLMTGWIFELLSTGRVEVEPGYDTPRSRLVAELALDRLENMAESAASRLTRLDTEPRDKINLPGWHTGGEMLKPFDEDNSLAKNRKFRYWINRYLADEYRAQNAQNPPQVSRNRSKAYCYPPSFKELVGSYIEHWNATRSAA